MSAEPGWAGIWTLTYAAARAASLLADDRPVLDALLVTYAASAVRAAQDTMEWAHPWLPAQCAAIDLGHPERLAHGRSDGLPVVARLITEALGRVEGLLASHPSPAETSTLIEVEKELRLARGHLLGRHP